VAGGGARNPALLQIKADVSGCRIEVFPEAEATLLGAALAAGVGSGFYPDAPAALAALAGSPRQIIQPDLERHAAYRALFEDGYLRLQAPLHEFARRLR
jgi:sugar (pentulose or hexulose) kinase